MSIKPPPQRGQQPACTAMSRCLSGLDHQVHRMTRGSQSRACPAAAEKAAIRGAGRYPFAMTRSSQKIMNHQESHAVPVPPNLQQPVFLAASPSNPLAPKELHGLPNDLPGAGQCRTATRWKPRGTARLLAGRLGTGVPAGSTTRSNCVSWRQWSFRRRSGWWSYLPSACSGGCPQILAWCLLARPRSMATRTVPTRTVPATTATTSPRWSTPSPPRPTPQWLRARRQCRRRRPRQPRCRS